jgi:hypothetical protein
VGKHLENNGLCVCVCVFVFVCLCGNYELLAAVYQRLCTQALSVCVCGYCAMVADALETTEAAADALQQGKHINLEEKCV